MRSGAAIRGGQGLGQARGAGGVGGLQDGGSRRRSKDLGEPEERRGGGRGACRTGCGVGLIGTGLLANVGADGRGSAWLRPLRVFLLFFWECSVTF